MCCVCVCVRGDVLLSEMKIIQLIRQLISLKREGVKIVTVDLMQEGKILIHKLLSLKFSIMRCALDYR